MNPLRIDSRDIAAANRMAQSYSVYLQTDVVPIRPLYESSGLDIFFLHGISHSGLFWKSKLFVKTKPQILLFTLPWYHGGGRIKKCLDFIQELAGDCLDGKVFAVLCNAQLELKEALEAGVSESILCNNNCWLDWRLFKLSKVAKKKYDMVINVRPEGWKRAHLASKVGRLAVIKGKSYRQNDFFDLHSLSPDFINDERISPKMVSEVISSALVGGCFSREEGACYASSEFLLAGLPVVSTESLGGRDVWYTPQNSIVVEDDTPECVQEAVSVLSARLLAGEVNPLRIRTDHIGLQQHFRDEAYTLIEKLAAIVNVAVDGRQLVESQFSNKMKSFRRVSVI